MKPSGNTIFITGGGSGMGRGLAEALHKAGNQVIISGRRKNNLEATTSANPGMASIEMDVNDPASIASVAEKLIAEFPNLNVIINNAGIMELDDVSTVVDEVMMQSTVTTNLLGPIRVTSAFVEHLKKQPDATIFNVSSYLGFVPLAVSAVYSSTKAAMHSYTQSLRWRLQGTSVKVREIAPPWVKTGLLDDENDPRAMPLAPFIAETIALMATDENELLVAAAKPVRAAVAPDNGAFALKFNDGFVAG